MVAACAYPCLTMSLDTLLEAANFLELRNQSTVKARGK